MMVNVDNRLLEIIKEMTGSEITFQQVKEANKVRKQERLFQKGTYINSRDGFKIFFSGALCRKLTDADLFYEASLFAREKPEEVEDYIKGLNL